MIAMDFRCAYRQERGDQRPCIHDAETNVRKASLIRAPHRIANDERKFIDAEVIVIGSPDGAADEETPVAAAKINHERRASAENSFAVERRGWTPLEVGFGPLILRNDFARERNPELALN